MTDPWLDDLLDRHPGEPVPEGFAQRLRARIEAEEADPEPAPAPAGELLRPAFGSWLARGVAAALLLAVGFWLGRDQPAVDLEPAGPAEEALTAEGGEVDSAFLEQLDQLYQDQELLDSWDLVANEELELALRDATLGTWELEEGEE